MGQKTGRDAVVAAILHRGNGPATRIEAGVAGRARLPERCSRAWPRRVVSLGYTTQDPLFALGVPPVAVRHWFGDFPYGVGPWAQPYLGGVQPVLLIGGAGALAAAADGRPDTPVASAVAAGLAP